MGKILIYKIIALGEKGGNAGGYLVDVNAFLKKQRDIKNTFQLLQKNKLEYC